jgi:hypothetical protein
MARSKGFKYRENSAGDARAAGGGDYDKAIDGRIKLWTPGEGKHRVRLMPRTWDDDNGPKHWAYTAFIHYSIGADNGSFLCLAKMKGQPCPICEERQRLAAAGDEDAAGEIRPVRSQLVYVIDRKNEADGPMIWKMPVKSVHEEIADRSEDEDTGELLRIDHPEEGHDVLFRRKGTQRNTSYSSVEIARKATPLCDDEDEMDEWLDFVDANPIPDMLVFRDYDYIAGVFGGGSSRKNADDEDDVRTRRRAGRSRSKEDDDEEDEDEEEAPRTRRSRRSSSKPPRAREVEDDDEDEEDEDEEEAPRTRRSGRSSAAAEPAPRARRSRRTTEDEDEDEDKEPEEDDDDVDASPRGRSRGRRSGRGSRGDDDDDELDDLDEPDEKPKRRSSRADLRDEVSDGLKGRRRRRS